MDAVDAVIARLQASIPELVGRVEGAMAFADLMRRNSLPQVTPAAFVLPLGLQGGAVDVVTGLYRQDVTEVIAVLVTLRSFSQTGGAQVTALDQLVRQVRDAIAGWAPDDAFGVFRLVRGQIVNMAAGTAVYQIDFAISDQLRIPT